MKENTFVTNVPKMKTEEGNYVLYPFSPPIFQTEVDQFFINDLLEEGKKLNIEKHDYRENLAGNMKYGGSFVFDDEFILKCQPYLLQYVQDFFNNIIENFGSKEIDKLLYKQVDRRKRTIGNLQLDTMWINYQTKHDYNPPHTHTGALSFVVFCKVPNNIFDDQAVSNCQDAGRIVFTNGESSKLRGFDFSVTPYETLMLIFPSDLKHSVPPFWANEERISVSGNFVVV